MLRTRGYCESREDRLLLLAYGLTDRETYQLGRGAETLPACIASFRGELGRLVLPIEFKSRTYGNILVMGLPPGFRESMSDLLGELSNMPTLRRLFQIL